MTQNKLAAKNLAHDKALFKDGIIAQRRYLEAESAQAGVSAALAQSKHYAWLV